ncbi:transcriptional regulator [Actinoplanes sp. SE50]|uniref:TetR family transcriptional regulator n=1 Tax=unclassified Actinoplanes TaxID=2626549 RepID=UPI00023EC881|nr:MULTISPECIES: TetR family transcriptional regulator [unclassified Actinoplanes]AEV87641.1 HTH-type transcriptional regulator betI [Actinoplanes sp. SE50/110]ATO86044.1 transcriptional regulator [Actinoplanes sp. SE50]SLM03458.1 TetR family transcriptional regulator [Actinoplanes sp. SE50/110]
MSHHHPPPADRLSRPEQKARTRQALLDAALALMEHRGLGSIGLREVTRAAGVTPTAFYRHFPDVDNLGVALVDECLGSLRGTIRAVRDGVSPSDEVINRSIGVLARRVRENREHFRFVARERHGGVPAVRAAIAEQLDLFAAELATDLAGDKLVGGPRFDRWIATDLRMISSLMVNHMVWTAAALLDAPPDAPGAQARVIDTAGRQLRLILLGARCWTDGD